MSRLVVQSCISITHGLLRCVPNRFIDFSRAEVGDVLERPRFRATTPPTLRGMA